MSLGHVNLTPQLVAAVRQAVDISAIAEDHTRLTRRGKRSSGLCPLHREKTPSFTVDPEQNLFYCFGCGQGGDGIKLHMLLSGDDFPAAIEALARRFGVPLPAAGSRGGGQRERDLEGVLGEAQRWFAEQLERHPEPRRYLEERRIPLELARRYGVGYAPPGYENLRRALSPRIPEPLLEAAGLLSPSERQPGERYDRFRHRLLFAIRNASGALVGFGGRTLGDDKAKYLNTPETERFKKSTLLFGLDQAKKAIREHGRALLVEGYFDVLGAVAAGVEGVVASMGTSLTGEQAALLARYTEEVVVGYDGDRAGEEASRRALTLLLGAGLAVRRTRLPAGSDPDSLRMEQGDEALQRVLATAPDAVEHELARLLPPGGGREPQAQARLAQAAAELLAPVKDPILRWAYGRRAAERLALPFELLAPRLGRAPARREGGRPAAAASSQVPGRAPGRLLEEAVLRSLLMLLPGGATAGALPALSEMPPPDAFRDDACKQLYGTACVLWADAGAPPPVSVLRERLLGEGGTCVDLVARLVIEGADPPVELPGRAHPSCEETLRRGLAELKQRWLVSRSQDLKRRMDEAQRAGDHLLLEELVAEKQEISREVHGGSAMFMEPRGGSRRRALQ